MGTYTVTGTIDETNFVGTATATLVIEKANQTPITFANPTSVPYGATLQLVPVGGSGSGAVTYSVRSGRCAISATGVLSSQGAGTCTLAAAKATSANHLAATSQDSTITVTKKDQSITFTSAIPSSPIAGTTYTPTATSTSGLAVSISITSGENTACSMANGVITFITKGSCIVTARQAGDANHHPADAVEQTISVGIINQSISFPQPEEHRIGEAAFHLDASASSGLAVTYSVTGRACAVSATGLVTILVPGTCDVTASQAGDATYAGAVPVTRTISIKAGLPGIPHLMSTSPEDSSIIVAYSTPPTNGGSPLVSYVVVATPSVGDPITKSDCSTTSLTCTLVGLTNGASYRVKVAAVTEAGVGDFSVESEPVTPFVAPQAVQDLTGVRQEESLQLTWVDPSSLGGGTLVRYEVSIREKDGQFGSPAVITPSSIGSIRVLSAAPATRRHTFAGLRKGSTYEVKVVTVTSLAASSTPDNTAQAVVQKMIVADSPRSVQIEAASESTAIVTWSTPLRDGGSPIIGYSATSSSGACVLATAMSLSCTMSNLVSGRNVTVSVKAMTAVGSSDVATASMSLPGRPGAPTVSSVARSGTSGTVTWSAPASDGGRPVTSYRITAVSTIDPKDVRVCSSTRLTCTLQGLAMSSAYNVTAKAFNVFGDGAASATYFSQAFSAIPSIWGSISDKVSERPLVGLPPAPGSVKVLASGSKSNVTATAPKTSIPITHAIITVAGTKGRVVLRLKVSIDKSSPQMTITVPYASSKIKVGVQFANAYGVSAITSNGWRPSATVTRQTDAAANVLRGTTAVRMVPVGTVVGQPVYFIGASSALSTAGKRALAAIAAQAKRDGGIVNVTGYARKSPTTSNAFIKQVSEQRALVVANYLASLGVNQWIRWQGVGAPTATTGSDADRRVVVSLTPYE